jgi:hypothetical protein
MALGRRAARAVVPAPTLEKRCRLLRPVIPVWFREVACKGGAFAEDRRHFTARKCGVEVQA